MIYIILSNIGMAVMMMFVYFRYSRFRLSSTSEIRELQQKFDKEYEDKKSVEYKLAQIIKADNDKVEALLREIDEIRKEKEIEVKIRLGAEKQVELALQKTGEISARMKDWSLVQDAAMKDSKDAILKVGNDLYKKLSDSYKVEVETNKNLIGKISKNISDFFDKISAGGVVANVGSVAGAVNVKKSSAETHPEDASKKLIADLVFTMKATGSLANKDYFLPANFDEQKAKLLLCEVAFINAEKLYIIDFKACNYFAEFNQQKDRDKSSAETVLKQKLDKYLAYLGNPKYLDSVLKALSSTKSKFNKNIITIILPSRDEVKIFREMYYYEKAHKAGFEVMDFDGINNLIL